MATTDSAKTLTRNQRLAMKYKRRERFEQWVRSDLGLRRAMYHVKILEEFFHVKFDYRRFDEEIADPRLCFIIETEDSF